MGVVDTYSLDSRRGEDEKEERKEREREGEVMEEEAQLWGTRRDRRSTNVCKKKSICVKRLRIRQKRGDSLCSIYVLYVYVRESDTAISYWIYKENTNHCLHADIYKKTFYQFWVIAFTCISFVETHPGLYHHHWEHNIWAYTLT